MRREGLQIRTFLLCLAGYVMLTFIAGGGYADAAEKPQPAREEYQTQYDDAVKLADMLRESPDLVYNKLYTAEQEVQLQEWVDNTCKDCKNDREKAGAALIPAARTVREVGRRTPGKQIPGQQDLKERIPEKAQTGSPRRMKMKS